MQAFRLITLSNGLPVILQPLLGTQKLSIGFGALAGSRYETEESNGISHVLEHMFFRGGIRYPDEAAVGAVIDAFGGSQNAYTSNELVYYYAELPADALETGLDLIADMLINAQLRESDLDLERGPVLQELQSSVEDPGSQVYEAFKQALYVPGSALARDILGPRANIESFSRDDLIQFSQHFYAADNAILSIAGNIAGEDVSGLVEQHFAELRTAADVPPSADALEYRSRDERIVYHPMDRDQTWVTLGVPADVVTGEDGPALQALTAVLGGGLSSRLFIRVRSERGLAYSSFAHLAKSSDHSVLSAWAGVDPSRILEAVNALIETCQSLYLDVDEAEYQRSISGARYRRIMQTEGAGPVANMMARNQLVMGGAAELSDYYEELASVTPRDIAELAERLFADPAQFRLGLAGGLGEDDIQAIQNGVAAFRGTDAQLLS